jgi:hypothetical protein
MKLPEHVVGTLFCQRHRDDAALQQLRTRAGVLLREQASSSADDDSSFAAMGAPESKASTCLRPEASFNKFTIWYCVFVRISVCCRLDPAFASQAARQG